MPEQISLTGFDSPPRLTDRLFFALLPSADVAERIEGLVRELGDQHGLKGRRIPKERMHVTLRYIGDFAGLPQDIVALARQAASAVSAPPFELVFDRIASFAGGPGSRPLVLRGPDGAAALSALMAFQQTLSAALQKVGLVHRAQDQFTAHLTLAYDERKLAEQAVEPIAWVAREFVLVNSLIGRGRHVTLARWPLRG
jgi:2'-5' RNA ligase